MSLKDVYYYLFYKYYKLAKWSPSIFPSDMVATISVASLELWTMFSFYNYYDITRGKHSELSFLSFKGIIPILIILSTKFYYFGSNSKWKPYFHKYERWPKEKNLKGTWIIIILTVFVFLNLGVSFYLNRPQ